MMKLKQREFFFILFLLAGVVSAPAADHSSTAPAEPLKIGIVGDSTVCDYKPAELKRGWGQMLPEFLKPDVIVMNKAIAGMSTKTFPKQVWQDLLAAHPDIVLIQFGHNDSHPKSRPEATDAKTDYPENLRNYVKMTRAADSTPILVTPMHRRVFKSDGHLSNELHAYVEAMKQVGQELNVPVIDLYAASGVLFSLLGDAGTAKFTVNNLERGSAELGKGEDRTHFTEAGARQIAKLVVAGFASADPRLGLALKPDVQSSLTKPLPAPVAN